MRELSSYWNEICIVEVFSLHFIFEVSFVLCDAKDMLNALNVILRFGRQINL